MRSQLDAFGIADFGTCGARVLWDDIETELRIDRGEGLLVGGIGGQRDGPGQAPQRKVGLQEGRARQAWLGPRRGAEKKARGHESMLSRCGLGPRVGRDDGEGERPRLTGQDLNAQCLSQHVDQAKTAKARVDYRRAHLEYPAAGLTEGCHVSHDLAADGRHRGHDVSALPGRDETVGVVELTVDVHIDQAVDGMDHAPYALGIVGLRESHLDIPGLHLDLGRLIGDVDHQRVAGRQEAPQLLASGPEVDEVEVDDSRIKLTQVVRDAAQAAAKGREWNAVIGEGELHAVLGSQQRDVNGPCGGRWEAVARDPLRQITRGEGDRVAFGRARPTHLRVGMSGSSKGRYVVPVGAQREREWAGHRPKTSPRRSAGRSCVRRE